MICRIKVHCMRAFVTGGCHTPFSLSWMGSLLAEVSAGFLGKDEGYISLEFCSFMKFQLQMCSVSPFCEIEKHMDWELRYYWNNDSNIERYSPEGRKRWHQQVLLSMTMPRLAWRAKAKANRESDLEDPQWIKEGSLCPFVSSHSHTQPQLIKQWLKTTHES